MDKHAWNAKYEEKELLWTAEPNRFVVGVTDHLEPGEALDLAGGEGRNAVWLASKGWRVTVVDWSDVALGKGRMLAERHGAQIDWVEADLSDWVPPEHSADLVLVVYLQVPKGFREAVWRGAARAVRPGGRLVVVGHDLSNLTQGYGGPQEPSVLYTAKEVATALGGLLTVERSETVLRPGEDDGVRFTAVDNLVVGVAPG